VRVPTYYVPSGNEHVQQTPNEPAEAEVLRLALAGVHVHTWSKDTSVMCVSGLEDMTTEDGRVVKVPVMVQIERDKMCDLGNKERF
jgi:hypothetical protein